MDLKQRLSNINPDIKRGLDYKFTWGAKKGKTIKEVIDSDFRYIDFLKREKYLRLSPEALTYLIRTRNEAEKLVQKKPIDFYTEDEFNALMNKVTKRGKELYE